MNMKQLRALIETGMTDEQIRAVMNAGKQGPEKDPDPAGREKQKGTPEPVPDVQKQILAAITGLTETIQASNLVGAKNKEPESIDDMLEGLIIEN